MIAAWRSFDASPIPPDRALGIAAALGRYEETPPSALQAKRGAVWAGARDCTGAHDGVVAALSGWIDNAAELADLLGMAGGDPASLYAAAIARWGEDADARVIGSYAAAALLPDGTLRAARSPWDAPPLYVHADAGRAAASTLVRVLFAAGAPRDLDHARLLDELAWDFHAQDEASQWRGIARVPLGAVLTVSPRGRQCRIWHCPPVPAPDAAYREDEAVLRTLVLLDEAAAHALAWAGKPALALSGGLDSPLVAASLLRAGAAPLTCVTFGPDPRWGGEVPPGGMGDERALVRDLSAALPGLDCYYLDREVPAPHHRAREVFAACDVLGPGLANTAMMHGVYAEARRRGCDGLLSADMGNATFSEGGRAAYCAYLRPGTLGELTALLRARPGDERSLWRKVAALSVLPRLPAGLRRALRGAVHPARTDMLGLFSPLSAAARAGRRQRSAWDDFHYDRSRAETVQREWREADSHGKDIDLAFEQIYRLRRRDVTAYRPLVEYCLSLPLAAFARGGVERRLARAMARARLPAAIAGNRLHGEHNVDWHARMTPARPEMLAALDAAAAHPFLRDALDIARLRALIDDWPEMPGHDWEVDLPRRLALPRAMLAARFIGHVEGRNDL